MARTFGPGGAVLAACALAFSGGCSPEPAVLDTPSAVAVPAAEGSMAPNLAVGRDGRLYLSWIEPEAAGHALRFATWTGSAWSAPRTVARGDDWFVNWADFPSLAALDDGTLAAHWLVMSGAETYAYEIRVALSADGGQSWSTPIRPHRDDTPTEHGFVSLLPGPANRFELVWLDGRQMGGEQPGAMTLRYATLARDGTLAAEARIDDAVCDCCSTDALHNAAGQTLVAYRDRSAAEVRDISVSLRGNEGWSTPRAVHRDDWTIAACPVNGPALAGAAGSLAVAWFTAAGDRATVYVAFSSDGGRSFDDPVRVDDGRPLGRVDAAALDDGSILVSWLEQVDAGARVRLRRVRPGAPGEAISVAETSAERASGVPRLARLGRHVVLAWTEAGEPSRVRSAVLTLPDGK